MPHVLLVNPWIHDFAAYDVWAKPYGLLILASVLRAHGIKVTYIDCLDRFHPNMPPVDPRLRHGRGPYLKTRIPNPPGLTDIKRTYSRYGIAPEWLQNDLSALSPRPDLILVTSLMTYWYPGVVETIAALKQFFPQAPVVLGGIYARLWPAHAKANSGADLVADGTGDDLLDLVEKFTGYAALPLFDLSDMDALPFPSFDLQRRMGYVPLLTTRGCPFSCAYCASRFLEPSCKRRSWRLTVKEILYWQGHYGVKDFAFYDDALLVDAQNHAIPMLEAIIEIGQRIFFHTPNALHIRAITARVARLMNLAGFYTLRLGLETTDFESRDGLDNKVARDEFLQAVTYLKEAGFTPDQIGAYLLVGLPDQEIAAVERAIEVVKSAGITPILAHYTPIPHTALWDRAVAVSRYDLNADPVFSNNALFPCSSEGFSWQTLSRLKQLARF